MTNDLDICFSRDRGNLKKLAAALAPYHPRPRGMPADLPFVWAETTIGQATIYTLDGDLGDIDLLAEVAGVGGYDEAVAQSVFVQSFGRRVRTLDLAPLIRTKRASGRVKDLAMLPELEALLAATREP